MPVRRVDHKNPVVVTLLAIMVVMPLSLVNQSAPKSLPIKHVIVIMEENHMFDNYFGTYPGANGLSPGIALPTSTPSNGLVSPFHLAGPDVSSDLDHSWGTAHAAYDNGSMDRFVIAENTNTTIGYFDYREIPYYWDYATQFVLLDNFYSSMMGPSLPNHLYLIAGQSGGLTDNARSGKLNFTSSNIHNDTFEFKSIVDELDANHISWRYYGGLNPTTLNNWNPLPAFAGFRANQTRMQNLAPSYQFISDIESNNLPEVVWVMPSFDLLSEHPPYDVSVGQRNVVSLINAVMTSDYWDSTAIFLAWDDYGGWYDHVPPRQVDAFGYGFRVPSMIISPYAKRGFIDHTLSDFTSFLKFVEVLHSLPPLTGRDSAANDLMEAFDFAQAPRSPLVLPGPFIPNIYPLTPLGNGSAIPLKTPENGQLPNLVVTRVSLSPSNPRVEDDISVSFTVANVGTADVNGVTVGLYFDGLPGLAEHVESFGGFTLREHEAVTSSFSSQIEAIEGVHNVVVVVDDLNEIREIQDDNNAFIRVFSVAPESSGSNSLTTQAATSPSIGPGYQALYAATLLSVLAVAIIVYVITRKPSYKNRVGVQSAISKATSPKNRRS